MSGVGDLGGFKTIGKEGLPSILLIPKSLGLSASLCFSLLMPFLCFGAGKKKKKKICCPTEREVIRLSWGLLPLSISCTVYLALTSNS